MNSIFQPTWGSTYAKPKDPSELDIEDQDLARDYKLMYNKYTEMEAKIRGLSEKTQKMWMRYWNYISTQTKENFNIFRSSNLFLSLYQDKYSIFGSGFCLGHDYHKKFHTSSKYSTNLLLILFVNFGLHHYSFLHRKIFIS